MKDLSSRFVLFTYTALLVVCQLFFFKKTVFFLLKNLFTRKNKDTNKKHTK
jgi:hypothetical protein